MGWRGATRLAVQPRAGHCRPPGLRFPTCSTGRGWPGVLVVSPTSAPRPPLPPSLAGYSPGISPPWSTRGSPAPLPPASLGAANRSPPWGEGGRGGSRRSGCPAIALLPPPGRSGGTCRPSSSASPGPRPRRGTPSGCPGDRLPPRRVQALGGAPERVFHPAQRQLPAEAGGQPGTAARKTRQGSLAALGTELLLDGVFLPVKQAHVEVQQ